jgi:hypothetical protein
MNGGGEPPSDAQARTDSVLKITFCDSGCYFTVLCNAGSGATSVRHNLKVSQRCLVCAAVPYTVLTQGCL